MFCLLLFFLTTATHERELPTHYDFLQKHLHIHNTVQNQKSSETCLKFAVSSLLFHLFKTKSDAEFPDELSPVGLIKGCELCDSEDDQLETRIFEWLAGSPHHLFASFQYEVFLGNLPTETLKRLLLKYGVAVLKLRLAESFMRLDANNFVYKEGTGEHFFHVVEVVGFNEHGWLIQNSYGENWGKGGFAVIPYFCTCLRNFYFVEFTLSVNNLV